MSLPKKNSRTLVIGDKTYRYLIRTKYDEQELFVQEDCKNPGRLLHMNISHIYTSGGKNLGLGPGDIRAVIEQSIAQGWDPSEKRATKAFTPKKPIEVVRKEKKVRSSFDKVSLEVAIIENGIAFIRGKEHEARTKFIGVLMSHGWSVSDYEDECNRREGDV